MLPKGCLVAIRGKLIYDRYRNENRCPAWDADIYEWHGGYL